VDRSGLHAHLYKMKNKALLKFPFPVRRMPACRWVTGITIIFVTYICLAFLLWHTYESNKDVKFMSLTNLPEATATCETLPSTINMECVKRSLLLLLLLRLVLVSHSYYCCCHPNHSPLRNTTHPPLSQVHGRHHRVLGHQDQARTHAGAVRARS